MTCCCETPAKIKDVSKSVEDLIIGTLANNTQYKAVITHLVTGNQYIQDVTSDGSGLAAIDMTSPDTYFYMRNNRYRIHFIETDYSDEVLINMDGTNYNCVEFTIVVTKNSDDECETFVTQTAVLCNA